MKISVIMIDGSFRENIFGSKYFCEQDFPSDEFEVIWVEFYKKENPEIKQHPNLQIVCLGHDDEMTYHSSLCFNEGIRRAKGEVIVIPDADQIVKTDFLKNVWEDHQRNERLVSYGYRYDERRSTPLENFSFEELEKKCIMKNPNNYGGVLTVRKKWLLTINGYEEHPIFSTGFHANGLDMYTRLMNLGLEIKWNPDLVLFHPWHPFTLTYAPQYKSQHKLIEWRRRNIETLAFQGLNNSLNRPPIDFSIFNSESPSIPKRDFLSRVKT